MKSYFQKYPELEEFSKELLKVIDDKINKAMRPANEVILDDLDLQQMLHISKRTAATLREEGLIKFSKPKGKIYYTLQDALDYITPHAVQPNGSNLKNDQHEAVL